MTASVRTQETMTPQAPPGRPAPPRRRRWWRVVLTAALAAGLVAAGGYAYLRATSGVVATGTADCGSVPVSGAEGPAAETVREAVCDVIAGLEASWAANDAEAYGARFTADATYTTYAGTHYEGRAEIVSSHAALFGDVLSGSRLANSYLALRILTDDVAILTTRGDTYEGDEAGTPTKVQTYTLVRDAAQWRVAAFHNTQRKPVMERIQYLWMPDTRPAAER